MYRDEVSQLLDDTFSEKANLRLDFAKIYIKMLIFLPNLVEERKNLTKMVVEYCNQISNEQKILSVISKRFGKVIEDEDIDELLDIMEDMYADRYEYCQKMLKDYESVIEDYDNFVTMLAGRIEAFKNKKRYAPDVPYKYRMYIPPAQFQGCDDEYREGALDLLEAIELPKTKRRRRKNRYKIKRNDDFANKNSK